MERIEGQKWTKLQLQRAREGMSKLALFRRALLSVRQQGGIGKAGPLRDALGELLDGRMTAVLKLSAQDVR